MSLSVCHTVNLTANLNRFGTLFLPMGISIPDFGHRFCYHRNDPEENFH